MTTYVWTPTFDDIAAHLIRRLEGGAKPDEVDAIERFGRKAANEVVAAVGIPPDGHLAAMATVAASYRAAYHFELTHYPEQEQGGIATLLRQDYVDALARLEVAAASQGNTPDHRLIGSARLRTGLLEDREVVDEVE